MRSHPAMGIAICFAFACFQVSNARATPSLWNHNGSTVYLTADGATREFHYNQPRSGMLEAGARSGSLLFTGTSINGRYVGIAYIFNRQCGQVPYQVSGPILNNDQRVVLTGQAPRVGSDCHIQGYYADTLEFTLLSSGGTSLPPPTIQPAPDFNRVDAKPLSAGDELRVVNVGANDVLNIRESATDKSPIIDIIPPDSKGVVYLGESQGQWIFVRYDRAKGWVNSRFVTPMVSPPSRGGRI
jgi:hypothetical protein